MIDKIDRSFFFLEILINDNKTNIHFFLLNFSAPYRKIQSYDNILSKRSGIFLKIFAIVYTVIMRVFF